MEVGPQPARAGADQQHAANAGDRAQKPGDRPAETVRLESEKARDLLSKTIAEMKEAIPHRLTADLCEKAEAEIKKGEFGPNARQAYGICARFLAEQVTGNLILLDSRGLEIPAGCPLEPPVDPRSGRHIIPEWFRAKIQSGDLRPNLDIETGKAPTEMDLANLRAAGIWSTRAIFAMNSAIVESDASLVRSQIEAMNVDGGLKGWLPRENLTDLEKERWTQAARDWLNKYVQVRNYAHAIVQLNLDTKQSTSPDKLFGIELPKWSTIPRQIFPDEALKDENFPGHVERNADGSIKSIRIEIPENLDRTGPNLEKIQKLEAWLEKYGTKVDQLVREMSFAAAKEGRMLAWGDVPAEGTIKRDGFNVVINQRTPDERGGFIEIPVKVLNFKTEKEADDALRAQQAANKRDIDEGKITIKKEPNEQIEYSENPGWLLGGRKLAAGEKEFNLREFRFTAKEVSVDGQPMIEVQSTQKFQYSCLPYDIAARDMRTTISGSADQPVRYKPDDWVCVLDGGRTMIMQARFLPRFATEGASWHYGMKGANIAMDVGFVVTGGFEIGALYRQTAKTAAREAFQQAYKEALKEGTKEAARLAARQAAEQAAKLPLASALKIALMSHGSWHVMLGATGVAGRPIEAGFGKYGHEFMKYRTYVMLADITWNQLYVGDIAKKAWGAARGTTAAEKTSAVAELLTDKGPLGFLYRRTGNILLGTEFLQIGDILGRAIPDMLAQQKTDSVGQAVRRAASLREPVFTPETPALLKIDSLVKETDKVKRLAAGTQERKEQEKALTTQLTTTFLDSKSQDERLAAALALINLKGKENQPAPENLGSRMRGQTEETLKLSDVQKFLREYQQQQLAKLITDYDGKLSVQPADLSLKRSAEILALPESNGDRQRHIDKLVEKFKEFKTLEDKVKEKSVALEKAKQDERDGQEKSNTEKAKLAKAVADATTAFNQAKTDWDKADKRVGAAAAIGLIAFGITTENGQGSRALAANKLKAEDVMSFLERQSKTSNRSDVRYTATDMLFRMGRADLWQLGSTCQEVLRDKNLGDSARSMKVAAMLNESSPRIGELLELMRFDLEPKLYKLSDQKDRAKAFSHTFGRDSVALQESLLEVVRNPKEDPDVRAMAVSLLLAAAGADKTERQALFKQCHDDWQKFSGEPGRFAKQLIATLKADLTRNTDGGDESQRQKLLEKKFRAALALSELGGPAELGIDTDTVKRTTQALIDCLDYTKPTLALQVLPHLVPKRLGELTPQQLKDLRDTAQQMLGPGSEAGRNTPDALINAQARTPLRIAIIEKLPQIMEGATDRQKADVASTLKGIISYDARYGAFFAAGAPELRKAALDTLVKFAVSGNDALKQDVIQLANNLAGSGEPSRRDASPDVRVAALNALQTLKATDLQATSLKLLKSEKDPLVLERLWALEYSNRRLDVNSPKYRRDFDEAQKKLLDSIGNSSLQDGKDFLDEVIKRPKSRSTAEVLEQLAAGDGQEAVRARRAAAWVLLFDRGDQSEWAARVLVRACMKEREKAPKELANLVERCLLANSQMQPVARANLLLALDVMKPGSKDSPVSREEAAIIFATVLERDLKHLPKYNVPDNPLDSRTPRSGRPGAIFERHGQLEALALQGLAKYSTEKVIPLLESLAEDNIDRDAAGRMVKIAYPNGKSREFFYEDAQSRNLTKVIEQPSGEIWTRGNKEGEVYKWSSNKGGSLELRAAIVNNLDEYLFQEKDGTIHGFTDAGGEVKLKDRRLIEVVYPNGSGRRFTYENYEPFRGMQNVRLKSVTELPSGEVWTRDDKDERKWTSSKGGTRTSYSEFVVPNPDRYGGAGGDVGAYCRVVQVGETPVMEVFTSSGAKLSIKLGVITEEDSGSDRRNTNIHSTHPVPEVRQAAKQILASLRDEIGILKTQAEEELKLFPERGRKSPQQMAEDISAALADPKTDSAALCRTIYLNCLTTQIKNVEDPRRMVLQQAMRDPHEQVRLAAAHVLFLQSDLKADREQAVAILADIEKNGSRAGYKKDASALLTDVVSARPLGTYHTDDFKLVAAARERAVNQPRIDTRESRRSGDAVDATTVEFQKAFERVKVELEKSPHHALTMNWDSWHRWFSANKLGLLEPVNFMRLQEAAARKRWEGHYWDWKTSGWDYIRKEEQKERDKQIPYLWAQFDQLVSMARTLGDKDQTGIESREALVYIIISNGQSFDSKFAGEAVQRAAAGILDICKSTGPGRGDLDWALKTCLVEQPNIDPKVRLTLLQAMDELVAPKGKLSREFAASVAAAALETEYRNMPKPGELRYDDSVKLQTELLDRIGKYGNKELVAILEAVAKNHAVEAVKAKAREVINKLK
jgi:hypothetical protein